MKGLGKMRKAFVSGLMLSVLTVVSSLPVSAATVTVTPFPIGVFYPPDPVEASHAKYAEIAAMNANFVVGTNGVVSHASNKRALDFAEANGLKMIVHDWGMQLKSELALQTTGGAGWKVRLDRSVGQTFRTPATGTDWFIGTVALNIDRNTWPANARVKVCVYDSPAKTDIVGCDAVTGPSDVDLVEFEIAPNLTPSITEYSNVSPNRNYYLEVTTNSSKDIALVSASPNDSYANGQAYRSGVAQSNDLYFEVRFSKLDYVYDQDDRPSDEYLDQLAAFYSNHPALLGYNLKDEPPVQLAVRLKQMTDRLKSNDPNHMTFVNLFPTYGTQANFGFFPMTGEYAKPTKPLGQTFKTGSAQTRVDTVQWFIDVSQITSGESVKLTLWNSPARTVKIAENTLTTSTSNAPQFQLNADVLPNTAYYMELTHNGGGDQSVGWVVRTQTGEKWEQHGNAYVDGAPIQADFWYTINQNITPQSYEDYVYRYVNKEPDVLVFDNYPYLLNGAFRNDYYENLEIIRRQALKGNVDFWSYIQSVGIRTGLRIPSESELRYQIYSNLAYGAKGYIYFTYETPQDFAWSEQFHDGLILPDGTKNATYGWAATINEEVLRLGQTLMGLKSDSVYHTGTIPSGASAVPSTFFWQPTGSVQQSLIGSFTDANARRYVMIVNKDLTQSHTLNFELASKPSEVKELSKATGLEVSTSYDPITGSLSVDFAPGEGRLFVLP